MYASTKNLKFISEDFWWATPGLKIVTGPINSGVSTLLRCMAFNTCGAYEKELGSFFGEDEKNVKIDKKNYAVSKERAVASFLIGRNASFYNSFKIAKITPEESVDFDDTKIFNHYELNQMIKEDIMSLEVEDNEELQFPNSIVKVYASESGFFGMILDEIKFLNRQFGIKYFTIDSLEKIKTGDQCSTIEYVEKLKDFCLFNKVSIVLGLEWNNRTLRNTQRDLLLLSSHNVFIHNYAADEPVVHVVSNSPTGRCETFHDAIFCPIRKSFVSSRQLDKEVFSRDILKNRSKNNDYYSDSYYEQLEKFSL